MGLPEGLRELGRNYGRLWLVEIRRWERDGSGKVKKILEQIYTVERQKHFAGVEIYAYELRKT